ncbi:MAG TPA: hypothetical protein DDW52_07505 [Planctomycetaceae bacterium]|nr:hypothetical protein [Planctomycetaceae bacterium]
MANHRTLFSPVKNVGITESNLFSRAVQAYSRGPQDRISRWRLGHAAPDSALPTAYYGGSITEIVLACAVFEGGVWQMKSSIDLVINNAVRQILLQLGFRQPGGNV